MSVHAAGCSMSAALRVAAATLALFATAVRADASGAAEHADLDRIFDAAMQRYALPGFALGVIEDGDIVYARTGGETVAGSKKKITRGTLFKIGSLSKAMTASVLARLVDAGKLRWDDPVTNYLPQFRMHDAWVTQHMTVRDLLLHRSGLREGAGDLMLWPEPNDYTRGDIVAGLEHLKPGYEFRAGYAYDNLLYVVAGEVAAAAGGASYEELVRREVFAPLQLRCRVGEWTKRETPDLAQPHTRRDGRNVVVRADAKRIPAITSAAAGGIRCSLDDMLTWTRAWLAPDASQATWLSAAQRSEAVQPRTPMPISARKRDWDHTHVYAYGHGWRMADVDGAWTVSHTGTLAGMYAALVMLPDRRNGYVFLINGDGEPARTVLMEVLTKRWTAPNDARGVAGFAAALEAAPPAAAPAATDKGIPARAADLRDRLGVWRDPWLGEAALCERGGRVRFRVTKSPLLAGTVLRVGSGLRVDWDDASVDANAWLAFDAQGRMTLAKVDPGADFSYDYEDLVFERQRACAVTDPRR